MKRPSISLCCILKNEITNLPQLLSSVKGCFDEIHLTDTGSDDGSIEYIENVSRGTNPAETEIKLHHFKWIYDFAAARNYSFSHPKTDYLMWLDLDGVLSSSSNFIYWRDNIMQIAEFWLATYHYASDATGKPVCSFARERVVKRDLNCQWKYFVHEGLSPQTMNRQALIQYATSWQVVHKRKAEDLIQDKNRNLRIFEENKDKMDTRMLYYFGKELFENGSPKEAVSKLLDAISDPKLESHDRVMGVQYAALSCMQLNEFERAIALAHQGMTLDPQRAEFYIIAADSYLKLGKNKEAIPYYSAASTCDYKGGGMIQSALFTHEDSYKHYPLNQLSRIYVNFGDIEKAEELALKAQKLGENFETNGILKDIKSLRENTGIGIIKKKVKTDEIVISCHPQGFYEWDEGIYKTQGIGGSETAAVEMAHWLSKITNRKVLVYNNRTVRRDFGNVAYLPAKDLPKYFSEYEPKVNISWRHNAKMTDSPNYVWCHDLTAPGLENHQNYEKALALSNFHKNFIHSICGVPLDKILVTRNGIDPDRFSLKLEEKIPGRVIFSSSPDRGLDRAIKVMDRVYDKFAVAELHCYYGFDNMLKMNKVDEVNKLQKMINDRPYVRFHGNLTQSELTKEFQKAEVWLYPTNFLETYCITAIEALCCSAYPVVRSWGALPDTLSEAKANRMATILDSDCESEEQVASYAGAVLDALYTKKHTIVEVDSKKYSWESVAREWIDFMGL